MKNKSKIKKIKAFKKNEEMRKREIEPVEGKFQRL